MGGPVKTALRGPGGITGSHGRFQSLGLDSAANEVYLFHGSNSDGAFGISESGFRMDLSGSNAGSMFGRGAYFAECSSKSDEYSKEGKNAYRGIYAMLICRV